MMKLPGCNWQSFDSDISRIAPSGRWLGFCYVQEHLCCSVWKRAVNCVARTVWGNVVVTSRGFWLDISPRKDLASGRSHIKGLPQHLKGLTTICISYNWQYSNSPVLHYRRNDFSYFTSFVWISHPHLFQLPPPRDCDWPTGTSSFLEYNKRHYCMIKVIYFIICLNKQGGWFLVL